MGSTLTAQGDDEYGFLACVVSLCLEVQTFDSLHEVNKRIHEEDVVQEGHVHSRVAPWAAAVVESVSDVEDGARPPVRWKP